MPYFVFIIFIILCLCFYPLPFTPSPNFSYQILCPQKLKGVADPKKCAGFILESTPLAEDNYRLGNTKAWWTFITHSLVDFFFVDFFFCVSLFFLNQSSFEKKRTTFEKLFSKNSFIQKKKIKTINKLYIHTDLDTELVAVVKNWMKLKKDEPSFRSIFVVYIF